MATFKKSSFPDSRLWQNGLAHSLITEGDQAECDKWLGWARQKLQFMLENLPGTVSQIFEPVDGIQIDIYTRPNRIRIKAEGGVFVTVSDAFSPASQFYSNPVTAPFQTRAERYLFASMSKNEKKEQFYSGGTVILSVASNNYDFIHAKRGGFWYDKKEAVSWTKNGIVATVFYNGEFYSTNLPNTNHFLTGAVKVDGEALRATYPVLNTYLNANDVKHVFAATIFRLTAPPDDWTPIIRLFLVRNNNQTVTINDFNLPGFLSKTANARLKYGYTLDGRIDGLRYAVTPFASDKKTFYYAYIDITGTSSSGSTQADVIVKAVLNDTYNGVTEEEIYRRTVQRYTLVKIDNGTSNFNQSEQTSHGENTFSFLGGEPDLAFIRLENDMLTLLRYRLSDYSQHTVSDYLNTENGGAGTYMEQSISSSYSITYNLQICSLTKNQQNAYELAIVSDFFAYTDTNSTDEFSSKDFSAGESVSDSSVVDNNQPICSVLYYSALNKLCVYEVWEKKQTLTQTTTSPNTAHKFNKLDWYRKIILQKAAVSTIVWQHNAATVVTSDETISFDVDVFRTVTPGSSTVTESHVFGDTRITLSRDHLTSAWNNELMLTCFDGQSNDDSNRQTGITRLPKTLKVNVKSGQYELTDGRLDGPVNALAFTSNNNPLAYAPISVTN